jgi:hypothetical protein
MYGAVVVVLLILAIVGVALTAFRLPFDMAKGLNQAVDETNKLTPEEAKRRVRNWLVGMVFVATVVVLWLVGR